MSENHSQFMIYQTEDGETKLDVRFENETVWLTQQLFSFPRSCVGMHTYLNKKLDMGYHGGP